MPDPRATRTDEVLELMRSGSHLLELRLCFHDNHQHSRLPADWVRHSQPHCHRHNRQRPDSEVCQEFCTRRVHRELLGGKRGRIHRCPFGFTELVAPVRLGGLQVGVLFAGACWLGRRPPPCPSLRLRPSRRWLRRRLVVLQALAAQLGLLLGQQRPPRPQDRRTRVQTFLQANMAQAIRLDDLARTLNLSRSRTRHLVRELFGVTFSELVRRTKMQEAARLLSTTDIPIGEVADRAGYDDHNYFSYVFGQQMGMSPTRYRCGHRREP